MPKSRSEVLAGLQGLSPDVPWSHQIDLGHDVRTIDSSDTKWHRKAQSLARLIPIILFVAENYTKRRTLEGSRALDIAPAEGGHSLAMARAGASVLGIEGRQLYVDRARFAATCLGLENARFSCGDVRRIDSAKVGTFDFVLCSGILHHLDADSFDAFLRTLAGVTDDTLLLYTHVSTPASIERFRLQPLPDAGETPRGYLFREHAEDATPEERIAKVRASLDNSYSFWAREEVLLSTLRKVGFRSVFKIYEPHLFDDWKERDYRGIYVVRK